MAARDYSKFQSPLPHPGEHLRKAQPVSPDTALRLAKVFGTSPDFWMNLQAQHDLSAAAIKSRRALKAIKPLEAA